MATINEKAFFLKILREKKIKKGKYKELTTILMKVDKPILT